MNEDELLEWHAKRMNQIKDDGLAEMNRNLRNTFEITVKSIEEGEQAIAEGRISADRLDRVCQLHSPFTKLAPLFSGPSAPFRPMPVVAELFSNPPIGHVAMKDAARQALDFLDQGTLSPASGTVDQLTAGL